MMLNVSYFAISTVQLILRYLFNITTFNDISVEACVLLITLLAPFEPPFQTHGTLFSNGTIVWKDDIINLEKQIYLQYCLSGLS